MVPPAEQASEPNSLLEFEIARARAAWEADFEHYRKRSAWWAEQPGRWQQLLCCFGTDVPELMLRCIITGVFIGWPLIGLFFLLLGKLGHPVDLFLEAGYVIFGASLFSAPLIHALDWCGYQLLAALARKDLVELPPWEPLLDLSIQPFPWPSADS